MPIEDDFVYECICASDPQGGQTHSHVCVVANRVRAQAMAIEAGQSDPPLIATLPDDAVAQWEAVAKGAPKDGPAGITHRVVPSPPSHGGGDIHVLSARNRRGRLTGLLFYYPTEHRDPFTGRVQPAGSVNMWVDPGWQGQGWGTKLVMEGNRLWPEIDLAGLTLTEGGAALARKVREVRKSTAGGQPCG